MLDEKAIAAASKTLHDHWRDGTKFAGLEDRLRPHDRIDGYAIQAEIEKYSSGSLFGWKIAATSEAGQKHINVDGPMAGRILAETVISDGGTASMAGNEMRVAEPEFAFRMRVDLSARPTPYTVQQVLDAVDTLHPAIEILRIRGLPTSSAPAPRRSLRITPARICSCWDRRQALTGVRWTSSRSGRSSRCAVSNLLVTARMCWAIRASH